MRFATLARRLDAYRHRVLSLDGDIAAASILPTEAGVVVEPLTLAKSGGLSVSNLRTLGGALKSARADLLCTYNWGALEAAAANRLGPRLPHLHFEDGFGPEEAARPIPRRAFARRIVLAGSIVALPSTVLQKIALQTWRLRPDLVRLTPNGIDVERFARRSPPPSGPPIVISVGALRAEKNYSRLVRCFDRAAANTGARLQLWGDGPEREKLVALAASLPSGARIEFPGRTASPEKALAGAHLFALSSDTEQTPLSLMEAMAAGLPAVSTDVGDVRMMLSEPNRPFVAAPADEDLLTAHLKALIEDASLRDRLGAANAARACAAFSEDAMVAAHAALYAEALRGG